jgi:hypothetical protein
LQSFPDLSDGCPAELGVDINAVSHDEPSSFQRKPQQHNRGSVACLRIAVPILLDAETAAFGYLPQALVEQRA